MGESAVSSSSVLMSLPLRHEWGTEARRREGEEGFFLVNFIWESERRHYHPKPTARCENDTKSFCFPPPVASAAREKKEDQMLLLAPGKRPAVMIRPTHCCSENIKGNKSLFWGGAKESGQREINVCDTDVTFCFPSVGGLFLWFRHGRQF